MNSSVICLVLFLQTVTCKKGYVKQLFSHQKLKCSSSVKKVYKVASEIQCVHRCLSHEKCGVLNYQQQPAATSSGNICEIYQGSQEGQHCSVLQGEDNWKAMIFKVSRSLGHVMGGCGSKALPQLFHVLLSDSFRS